MNIQLLDQLHIILKNHLPGLRIRDLEKGYGSFLLIHLGNEIQIKLPSGKSTFRSPWMFWFYMCSWRILKHDRYFIGSEDPQEVLQVQVKELTGKKILSCHIDDNTFDLSIMLEDNFKIESFAHMRDDEQWKLYCPSGLTFTLGNQGQIILQE